MILFGILFSIIFLLDAVIFPSIFNNYFGYSVLILFSEAMLVTKNQKSLTYSLIIFGLIYEILQGYSLGIYVLPLLMTYLLVLCVDHFINLRGYCTDRGVMKYILAPFFGAIILAACLYINLGLGYFLNSQKNISWGIDQFGSVSFLIYLYIMCFIIYWFLEMLSDKHEKRI